MKIEFAFRIARFCPALVSTLILFASISISALGQPLAPGLSVLGETDTTMPGVHYQVVRLARILDHHLLVVIRIVGTKDAPPQGVFLGGVAAGLPGTPSHIDPLSFDASTMTDELSGVVYPRLAPVAPPGKVFRPSVIMATIRPGRGEVVSVQFATPPPPPPPPPSQPPKKQILDFVFPKSLAPLKVELPPPDVAVAPGSK